MTNSISKRDYALEEKERVRFIQETLRQAGARGIVFANSGGKDCALAGVLCKKACENTVSLILPCGVKRSYNDDKADALELAGHFDIHTRIIDLKETFDVLARALEPSLTALAASNIAPRLRMQVLYAIALSEGRLVAGTGNRSEIFLGYFTKWGDGAYDFNPIADLTVTEVYEFLRYLNVPPGRIEKPPSAGLFEGQTDEGDLGFSYADLDRFLLTGEASDENKEKFMRHHNSTKHKRRYPCVYGAYNTRKDDDYGK